MGDEKGGDGEDTMGDKKGGMEGSARMQLQEATDQCRWFGTGMKGVDWGAGYQGKDTLDDESVDHRSEYEGAGFEYDECHRKREGPEYSEQFRPSETTLKSLPRFDENDLGWFSVDVIGQLALIFYNIMFPLKAIELLVNKAWHTQRFG